MFRSENHTQFLKIGLCFSPSFSPRFAYFKEPYWVFQCDSHCIFLSPTHLTHSRKSPTPFHNWTIKERGWGGDHTSFFPPVGFLNPIVFLSFFSLFFFEIFFLHSGEVRVVQCACPTYGRMLLRCSGLLVSRRGIRLGMCTR